MASIGSTYDPPSTAQALAEQFTAGRQSLLKRQSDNAAATTKGLSTLNAAMNAFQSKLSSLTSSGKTLTGSSAVVGDAAIASATAAAGAAAGTYSFFVEQLASAHKISYSGMTDFAGGGSLDFDVGGSAFNVDLSGKPTWTVRELAAAINGAAGNTSLSASVVSTGTSAELVLTARQGGSTNVISLSANGTDAGLAATLNGVPNLLANPRDAILHVGAENGTAIVQASNTFKVIDGVTLNVTKAQGTGDAPLSLTVATDSGATLANVQSLVDSYNELSRTVASLTGAGDGLGGAGGVFAGDSGVRALRERLVGMLRVSNGGVSLANYGIIANRDGTLSVNAGRLNRTLETNPDGLDALIGSSAIGSVSGIAGALDGYLEDWTDAAGGQIASRREAVSRLQADLASRQSMLDKQYDSAYARYLDQFSRLQAIQSQMGYNSSLFDSLFGSDSKD